MREIVATVALLLTTTFAAAQQAAPEPILRMTLDPAKVVVGQAATLTVEVLAPNYMTRPPVMPDFQVRNAVTRAASTVNVSERQGDISYAGIRFEFLIYPQEPGTYSVSGQSVTLTYADNPPHTREVALPVPRAGFEAIIPDAAQSLSPFISASRLTMRQEIQHSSDPLKVGDAVTRIVTVEADRTPAMLLPSTAFVQLDGAKLYPGEPALSERVDRRTGTLSARRIDRATYMLERPGTIALPAIEIGWWNVESGTVEHARIESAVLQVAANPAVSQGVAARGADLSLTRKSMLFILDHWLAFPLAAAALAFGAWALPIALRSLMRRIKRNRAAYLQSEAFAYESLRSAARRGDARETYAALLAWLSRFEPAASHRTIGALKARAGDPALIEEIETLERRLFAQTPSDATWSSRRLVRSLSRVRRKAKRRKPRAKKAYALPQSINFSGIASRQRMRPVAR